MPSREGTCGWYSAAGVVEIRSRAGNVYPAQLIICGRPWTEPVCAAKIRTRKGAELENLIAKHGENGGGLTFATFTPGDHHLTDPLESSLAVLRSSWKKVIASRRWAEVKARNGIMGLVLAYEFTHGRNGWHPHLHPLWFHREPLDARGIFEVDSVMRDRWELGIRAAGRYLHPTKGVTIKTNAGGLALAGYVTKVQEGDWGVAQELLRGDVKTARSEKGRVPFQILADYYRTGNRGDRRAGIEGDWELWQEFVGSVKLPGQRSIAVARMTPGLRKAIIGEVAEPVLSDEQLAAVEVGGELIAVIKWHVWRRVREARLGADLLAAGERDGLAGINELLAGAGLGSADPPG
jgi:hypothetical protein